jgi:hypothetical protein
MSTSHDEEAEKSDDNNNPKLMPSEESDDNENSGLMPSRESDNDNLTSTPGRKRFQNSFPLKLLDQLKPNLV